MIAGIIIVYVAVGVLLGVFITLDALEDRNTLPKAIAGGLSAGLFWPVLFGGVCYKKVESYRAYRRSIRG